MQLKTSYLDLPILSILVQQVGKGHGVDDFLFFIVMVLVFFISFVARQLTQWAYTISFRMNNLVIRFKF